MDETPDYLPLSTYEPLTSTGRVRPRSPGGDQLPSPGTQWVKVPTWLLPAVSGTAVAVYAAIAQHVAPGGGDAWPSHARLAALTGLHYDTARRAVAELERVGAIERRPAAWSNGRQAPNVYRVHVEQADALLAAARKDDS